MEASFARDSCLQIEAVFFPIVCFQFLGQPFKPRTEQNKSSRRSYRILIGPEPWIRRIKASPAVSSSTQQGLVSLRHSLLVCVGQQPGNPRAPQHHSHLELARGDGSTWLLHCCSSPSPFCLSLHSCYLSFHMHSPWGRRDDLHISSVFCSWHSRSHPASWAPNPDGCRG